MFFWIIIIIAVISIGLSILSLQQLKDKGHMKDVKKDLSKNRILYQDSSKSREE